MTRRTLIPVSEVRRRLKKTLLVDEKEMSKNALHKRKNKIHNSNVGKSNGETKDHQKTDLGQEQLNY